MAFEDDCAAADALANCGVTVLIGLNPLQVAMLIQALTHMHETLWDEAADGPDSPMALLAEELTRKTRELLVAASE